MSNPANQLPRYFQIREVVPQGFVYSAYPIMQQPRFGLQFESLQPIPIFNLQGGIHMNTLPQIPQSADEIPAMEQQRISTTAHGGTDQHGNIFFREASLVPSVTFDEDGIMVIRLSHKVIVCVSVEESVKISTGKGISAAIGVDRQSVAFVHSLGQVLLRKDQVNGVFNGVLGNRYFKIVKDAALFCREGSALAYKLDKYGVRTSYVSFPPMDYDITLPTFYWDTKHGLQHKISNSEILKSHLITSVNGYGAVTFGLCDTTITQSTNGNTSIENRNPNKKFFIRLSPTCGVLQISTPDFSVGIDLMESKVHPTIYTRFNDFFIRDVGPDFTVKNDKNIAGFNQNLFRIYSK